MFTKGCLYGIQAAVLIAALRSETFVPIREIGRRLGISHHFLTKVLQELTRAGHMRSFRGPNGGVMLARAAQEMTLKQLIEAVDGPGFFEHCVLGLPGCGSEKPCPLHDQWKGVRSSIDRVLSDVTVAELAVRFEQQGIAALSAESILHPAAA